MESNASLDYFEITTQTRFNYDQTKQPNWIVSVVIETVLMSLTLCILISLVHYGCRTKKWTQTQEHEHVLVSGSIYSCVIATAISGILRNAFNLTLLNVGYEENQNRTCTVIAHTALFFYISGYFPVTLFLWLRQRIFFTHHLLNVHYNRVIKFFSFACIIVFSGYALFLLAYTYRYNELASGSQGCKPTVRQIAIVYFGSGIGWSLVSHIVLVGLLAYALTHVKTFQAKKAQQRRGTTSELRADKNVDKIKNVLKKTVAIAIISIICDISLQIISFAISGLNYQFAALTYDIVLFINLLLLIFSFSSYKDILTSLFKKKKNQVKNNKSFKSNGL